MRMWLFLGIILTIYPVILFVGYLVETQRRRAVYRTLMKQWSATPEIEREALITQWLAKSPRSGAVWYLRGVLDLRVRRTQQAARAFGMAHHCDTNLVSAAMLTFVCLKSRDGSTDSNIQSLIETTWMEMKRPSLGQFEEEKIILTALTDDSSLAQSNWTIERVTNLVLSNRESSIVPARTGELLRAV